MSKLTDSPLSRRRVFVAAGTAGAVAAAAAVLPLAHEAPLAQTEGDGKAPKDADGRYQVTQHVLRYYQTARV